MTPALWQHSMRVYRALALNAEVITGVAGGLLDVISAFACYPAVQHFTLARATVFTPAPLTLRTKVQVRTLTLLSAVHHLHTSTSILTEVLTMTVLALVTQEALWTTAGWLVALVDSAVAPILAVVVANVQVAFGSSEASLTAAGRSTCA